MPAVILRLGARYRVRTLREDGVLIVEQLRGAVVGAEFVGRVGRTSVRFPRAEVSSTIDRAVQRYARLSAVSPAVRSWLKAVGTPLVEVVS